VGQVATRIAELLGETEPVQVERIPLPPAYRFGVAFGRIRMAGGDAEPRLGEPLRDTEDPWRIVRPFDGDVRMIAREAGLPEDGVVVRAVEVMRTLSAPDQWSAEAERRVRGVLDSAGLKMSFVRPRTQLVRRALFSTSTFGFCAEQAEKLSYTAPPRASCGMITSSLNFRPVVITALPNAVR